MFFWQQRIPNPVVDQGSVNELLLYLDNDSRFSYSSSTGRGRNVAKMLAKRFRRGTYDKDKAWKAWLYVVDEAAKAYAKGSGGTWYVTFPPDVRRAAAREYAEQFDGQYRRGELGELS